MFERSKIEWGLCSKNVYRPSCNTKKNGSKVKTVNFATPGQQQRLTHPRLEGAMFLWQTQGRENSQIWKFRKSHRNGRKLWRVLVNAWAWAAFGKGGYNVGFASLFRRFFSVVSVDGSMWHQVFQEEALVAHTFLVAKATLAWDCPCIPYRTLSPPTLCLASSEFTQWPSSRCQQ